MASLNLEFLELIFVRFRIGILDPNAEEHFLQMASPLVVLSVFNIIQDRFFLIIPMQTIVISI